MSKFIITNVRYESGYGYRSVEVELASTGPQDGSIVELMGRTVKLVDADRPERANLGLATTRELLQEFLARHSYDSDIDLDYRTVQ